MQGPRLFEPMAAQAHLRPPETDAKELIFLHALHSALVYDRLLSGQGLLRSGNAILPLGRANLATVVLAKPFLQ